LLAGCSSAEPASSFDVQMEDRQSSFFGKQLKKVIFM
jgi:hypothetical protein